MPSLQQVSSATRHPHNDIILLCTLKLSHPNVHLVYLFILITSKTFQQNNVKLSLELGSALKSKHFSSWPHFTNPYITSNYISHEYEMHCKVNKILCLCTVNLSYIMIKLLNCSHYYTCKAMHSSVFATVTSHTCIVHSRMKTGS